MGSAVRNKRLGVPVARRLYSFCKYSKREPRLSPAMFLTASTSESVALDTPSRSIFPATDSSPSLKRLFQRCHAVEFVNVIEIDPLRLQTS